ncbi:hypothetical protein [Bordetella avium]|uniref:hypothetical protein n=1 Tax=Bordetella avium TaxID=521 RepID=UPI00057AE3B3|nr:hypothetical protein [Bordetella avium]AZY49601.1 hypothetical protein C0J09_10985 [Bordetella avium]
MERLRDVDDFPVNSRVITPSGRPGYVVAHKGAHSKDDPHERCVVRYTDGCGNGADRSTVELLPHLLRPASAGPQFELF